jgi:hypothetical protein
MLRVLAFVAMMSIVLLMFASVFYAYRFIIQYRLDDKTLRIKLFGLLTVRRIRLRDIVEVRVIPRAWGNLLEAFRPEYLFAEKWPSYILVGEGAVFVRKQKGLSRRLILTPKNPQQFAEELLDRVEKASTAL